MSYFLDAYSITLQHEGGYGNDPDDVGGETYKGISRVYNPSWKGWGLIDDYKSESNFPKCLEMDSGLQILQLKAKSKLRSIHNITNYKLSYTEQKLDSQAIRTIKIHEGVLTTHGIEIRSDVDSIRFEQTEVISND